MKTLGIVAILVLGACGGGGGGGGDSGPLVYKNPPSGGALRLVKAKSATPTKMVLDLVVGDKPLTGYSTGFDLPLDVTKVTLGTFTPGTALSPGTAPVAAQATVPTSGPLANTLVVGQSQKASGAGAVATDTMLPAGTVLLELELDLVTPAVAGVVFDGQATGFVLPSGGLLDRAGDGIVTPAMVSIGTLTVVQ